MIKKGHNSDRCNQSLSGWTTAVTVPDRVHTLWRHLELHRLYVYTYKFAYGYI